ncbi:ribosome hibernation-promoting factor, HPF/YfiA family [Haliscomenobacter hydrossis]|mgnify:FL=1|uniref:Ribosomal subunit interface protein n=1 Tax=Haliscomenobacter hydrossis (strain ATCC 27775 / DSM 1100 / LMG 10767 / O) TaxID=760192 RepID=F4KUG9_HALH1|nr:ribosome-associated translation inhibitor RaiA [Haliscomenobacter hydrossis]AEE52405.1 ribosomal subunit interface protein [Haliscomenobacter hydrossis DSM 1100]
MVVYTEAVQFKVDSKLVDFIEKKLSKIDQFFDRIINARVVLKLENTGQVREKIAEVRINVPGETLFVKVTHKSFEAAVEQAVDSLKRQIIKYKEKQS